MLVLGHHGRRDLLEALCRIGIEPEVRGSVPGALERLRRGRLMAVLVDRQFARADALEFVLNVRDIEAELPVIVAGAADDESVDRRLRQQTYTVIIDERQDMDRLSRRIARAIERYKNEDQSEDDRNVTSGSLHEMT
jgi:DNA-binding NtrC family response regulator